MSRRHSITWWQGPGWRLALLAPLYLLVCGRCEAQLAPPARSGPPTLSSFTPSQAAAGSTVTITFSGTNFVARALSLSFSPSQGITVTSVKVVSSMQIVAQLQIDATAQAGGRQVILIDADRTVGSPGLFTITAAQNCPPGVAAAGCGGAPTLKSFTPLQGIQGASVTLAFSGANFTAPAGVQFTPSSGITVQSVTVASSSEIRAQLVLASNAALGSRGVVLTLGEKQRLTAANTFTVVSGAAPTAPMQILRVVPNQIAAGSQNVDLTLIGSNFVPGTQVTFTVGAGVPAAVFASGPARYIDSTEMRVTVSALSSALPGGRDIHLQPPAPAFVAAQPGAVRTEAVNPAALNAAPASSITLSPAVGKGMLNVYVPAPSSLPTTLKIAPINQQPFTPGVIYLKNPETSTAGADCCVTYSVPSLNDQTVFQWNEQNPGLADYYELRVYSKDGKTLLATQKITGVKKIALGAPGGFITVVPTFYQPDPAFLKALLAPALHPVISGGAIVGPGGKIISMGGAGSSSTPSAPAQYDPMNAILSQGDLQWEVAGFHTYNQNGVAPQQQPQAKQMSIVGTVRSTNLMALQSGQQGAQNASSAQNAPSSQNANATVDLLVEISDRWPLNKPNAPTGMTCGEGGMGPLIIKDLSAVNNNVIYYVGDILSLSGTLSLANSPYQLDNTGVKTPCTGMDCLTAGFVSENFANVFVDWGDGTTVVRLSASTSPQQTTPVNNWDPSQPLYIANPYTHSYASLNEYTIRVYQLSNDDLQNVSVDAVSASADGPTTPFLQAAVLSRVTSQGAAGAGSLTMTSLQSGLRQVISPGGGNTAASQAASDAYMLYCHKVLIKTLDDPAATGALHLLGISDPDFGPNDITPIKGRIGGGFSSTVPNPAAGGATTKTTIASGGRYSEEAQRAQQPVAAAGAQTTSGAASGIKLASPGALGRGSSAPSGPPAAICSACDQGMDATSVITYYGTGSARITWTIDGVQTSSPPISLGPSPERQNLTRADIQGYTIQYVNGPLGTSIPVQVPVIPPAIKDGTSTINSPPLILNPIGNHSVSVEADVLPPDATAPTLSGLVGGALRSLVPSVGLVPPAATMATSDKTASVAPNLAAAQSLLAALAAPAGSNLPPLKVGVLSSSNRNIAGLGAVQYVNDPVSKIVLTPAQPDSHVASNSKTYEVVASDTTKPCLFHFPVKSGGYFVVSGLQNRVSKNPDGTFSGRGNLEFLMANAAPGGYTPYRIPNMEIKNWSVPDGLLVTGGSIEVSPNLALDSLPALSGTLQRLSGQAGKELDATLNVGLSDNTLQNKTGGQVTWPPVTAELKANGDWIHDGLTMDTTSIGWSAFIMTSSSVTLDLSHHDGDEPAASKQCNGYNSYSNAGDWVGVRFKSLAITPYTFGLSTSLQANPTDWSVIDNGLCGTLKIGAFDAAYEAGSIHFDSITFQAYNHTEIATYNNFKIHIPWLDADLTGSPVLQSGGSSNSKGPGFSFSSLTSSPSTIAKNYGNFGFTARNFQFTFSSDIGDWVAQADTHFVFSAENKTFAGFDKRFYFGMDGYGHFAEAPGTTSANVSLSGSAQLGQIPVAINSVQLTAPTTGTQVLTGVFQVSANLSSVMSAQTVAVNYGVNVSGANPTTYATTGPSFPSFTIEVPWPLHSSSPSSYAKVHPVYAPSGSSGSTHDVFSGTVDLSELGGIPAKGSFRLGYYSDGKDYWLAQVSVPLDPDGVPIISVPPVMNLYRVQGGMGHNFDLNPSVFEDASKFNSVNPMTNPDDSFVFMAGVRLGMPDKFTYTLDGDLTMKPSGQNSGVSLDFSAWLLETAPDQGMGDFHGTLSYSSGSFDAKLWGHKGYLNDAAYFDLGSSANSAVDFHFGSGAPWHIYLGNKNGSRITGKLYFTSVDAYIMLDQSALSLGGGANWDLEVGDSSVASAWIKAWLDLGLTITPQPQQFPPFHAAGDFSAGVQAGVCAFDACVSGGVTGQIHAEMINPTVLRGTCTLGLPDFLPSVTFSASL
jgi:hypothetical protein